MYRIKCECFINTLKSVPILNTNVSSTEHDVISAINE